MIPTSRYKLRIRKNPVQYCDWGLSFHVNQRRWLFIFQKLGNASSFIRPYSADRLVYQSLKISCVLEKKDTAFQCLLSDGNLLKTKFEIQNTLHQFHFAGTPIERSIAFLKLKKPFLLAKGTVLRQARGDLSRFGGIKKSHFLPKEVEGP